MGNSINRKKIGLYGGTFNPIHFGHLNLALELKEKGGLDEVWFIPSRVSPFRIEESQLSSKHRLKMVELAISDIPEFKICLYELQRPPPSYTIETIQQAIDHHPNDQFFLMLGEDCLKDFGKWKDCDKIITTLPLLVGIRFPSMISNSYPLEVSETILNAFQLSLIQTRVLQISASEIRDRIKKRLYCGCFLPGKVLDYIYENQLYSNSPFIPKQPKKLDLG